MKKNILLYMAAVAGLVLAGCSKTAVPEAGSLNMTVKASIGNLTKVSTNGVKTTFDKGDALSLYAWIGSEKEVSSPLVVDGVVNTFDGESWIPETQMLWKNVHDDHYFIGISPAHKVVDFTADPFVLNPAEYEANDLLLAKELKGRKVSKELAPNPVSLTFSHALAKLNVHLKFRSQWAATPEVSSVATTAKAAYTVNYLTKEVTATGDDAQVQLQALTTTPQAYALSFSGLQVPQKGVTTITIVIDGKNFIYEAAEPIELLSGKITNIGLIVGREELTLDEISVEDWEAEGTDFGDQEMDEEKIVNLAELTENYVAHKGDILTGTLGANVKISIAEGARVTLYGATIPGIYDENYQWAGITCLGNTTIVLKGQNTVMGSGSYMSGPGIFIAEGKTLVIKGDGSLTASPLYYEDPGNHKYSYGSGAGIGGWENVSCGNIEIQGGNITATGGSLSAGIGGSWNSDCGTITISGGTIAATGSSQSPGIGSGAASNCGDITITAGVTKVTATKGSNAPKSIGASNGGTCGKVTIGGDVYPNGIGESPYVYPLTYPIAISEVTSSYVGSVIASNGKVYATASKAADAGTTARAIIAYVGAAGSVESSSSSYKGLAIAMSDAGELQWALEEGGFEYCLNSPAKSIATALGKIDGISCTSTLVGMSHDNHEHSAAAAAASNNDTATPTGTSDWFMPSMGQWNLIVKGLANKAGAAVIEDLMRGGENDTYKAGNLNGVITAAGGTGFQGGDYWASSEASSVHAWFMTFWSGSADYYSKNTTCYVRSVVAF